MVQGYYTLDEAARILGMDPEKLNQMAQKREIRAFADRGTWRFRTQDVDEMARRLGLGSSPDLQLGEAERSKPLTPLQPKSGPRSPTPAPTPKSGPKAPDEGVFDFSLSSDSLDPEHDIVIQSPSSHKGAGKGSAGISPTPKPGSDSDVHLVFDVGASAPPTSDSDVKLEEGGPPAKQGSGAKKTGLSPDPAKSGRKKTMIPGSRMDSGVRLVPMDEENVLPLGHQPPPSGTDSDIRLAPHSGGDKGDDEANLAQTTEDINLDEELRKAEEIAQTKKPRSKVKPKSEVRKPMEPPASALDLPAANLEMPTLGKGSKPDFGLANDQTAEIRLEDAGLGAGDSKVKAPGTDVKGVKGAGQSDSGITLDKPEDSSSDSLEFELSLEPESTPKPGPSVPEVDSSGEFELTLDEGEGLSKGEKGSAAHEDSDKDIFETDFDMPAVEEGSASDAVALEGSDTELESSDFDLSLGEEDSGSQVVALEEEADEGAQTVAYKGGKKPAAPQEGTEELDELLAEEEIEELPEEEGEGVMPRRAPAIAAAPANWGPLPAAVMLPCVIIVFLLGLMSFELLGNMGGYRQPHRGSGLLVRALANMFGDKLPD
jgi:excisionase family DNA binding protein